MPKHAEEHPPCHACTKNTKRTVMKKGSGSVGTCRRRPRRRRRRRRRREPDAEDQQHRRHLGRRPILIYMYIYIFMYIYTYIKGMLKFFDTAVSTNFNIFFDTAVCTLAVCGIYFLFLTLQS